MEEKRKRKAEKDQIKEDNIKKIKLALSHDLENNNNINMENIPIEFTLPYEMWMKVIDFYGGTNIDFRDLLPLSFVSKEHRGNVMDYLFSLISKDMDSFWKFIFLTELKMYYVKDIPSWISDDPVLEKSIQERLDALIKDYDYYIEKKAKIIRFQRWKHYYLWTRIIFLYLYDTINVETETDTRNLFEQLNKRKEKVNWDQEDPGDRYSISFFEVEYEHYDSYDDNKKIDILVDADDMKKNQSIEPDAFSYENIDYWNYRIMREKLENLNKGKNLEIGFKEFIDPSTEPIEEYIKWLEKNLQIGNLEKIIYDIKFPTPSFEKIFFNTQLFKPMIMNKKIRPTITTSKILEYHKFKNALSASIYLNIMFPIHWIEDITILSFNKIPTQWKIKSDSKIMRTFKLSETKKLYQIKNETKEFTYLLLTDLMKLYEDEHPFSDNEDLKYHYSVIYERLIPKNKHILSINNKLEYKINKKTDYFVGNFFKLFLKSDLEIIFDDFVKSIQDYFPDQFYFNFPRELLTDLPPNFSEEQLKKAVLKYRYFTLTKEETEILQTTFEELITLKTTNRITEKEFIKVENTLGNNSADIFQKKTFELDLHSYLDYVAYLFGIGNLRYADKSEDITQTSLFDLMNNKNSYTQTTFIILYFLQRYMSFNTENPLHDPFKSERPELSNILYYSFNHLKIKSITIPKNPSQTLKEDKEKVLEDLKFITRNPPMFVPSKDIRRIYTFDKDKEMNEVAELIERVRLGRKEK